MKTLIAILIALGFLLPAFAQAKSAPKDTTPPSITAIRISSSNANPSIAVPGDTVSISFTTSEAVQTPVVLVNARPLIMRAVSASGNNWVASYGVVAKDPTGKAEYAIAMADLAGNVYACTSPRIILIPYCPTTDGSSVTISKATPPPPPPPDTVPPVIAAHANVFATTTNGAGTAVSYALPTATDNVDGTDAVSCLPASGSTFAIGTTTVNCSAHDAAGNSSAGSFAVGVTLIIPPDIAPPVIAAHADVFATTTNSAGTAVSYALPAANDAHDGAVAVSCMPASGSTFAVGTTTVTCSAHDAAGNSASSSFGVGVSLVTIAPPPPTTYVMASQPDESFLCGATTGTWRFCDDTGTFGFTQDFGSAAVINLGQGSSLGAGALQRVTFSSQSIDPLHPWLISIQCYADASYQTPCSNWVAPATAVSRPDLATVNPTLLNRTDAVAEFAATTPDNGKHWVAGFTNPSDANFDGTSPIKFNPNSYYQLTIDDLGDDVPVYGSFILKEPYWVITGITQ